MIPKEKIATKEFVRDAIAYREFTGPKSPILSDEINEDQSINSMYNAAQKIHAATMNTLVRARLRQERISATARTQSVRAFNIRLSHTTKQRQSGLGFIGVQRIASAKTAR